MKFRTAVAALAAALMHLCTLPALAEQGYTQASENGSSFNVRFPAAKQTWDNISKFEINPALRTLFTNSYGTSCAAIASPYPYQLCVDATQRAVQMYSQASGGGAFSWNTLFTIANNGSFLTGAIPDGSIDSVKLASGAAAGNLGFTPLSPAKNLSDVGSPAAARSNIGAQAALGYTPLNLANNLSDVADPLTAQHNLGVYTGFKNRIINGGFDVWQRGPLPITTSSDFAPDHWLISSSAGPVTAQPFAVTLNTWYHNGNLAILQVTNPSSSGVVGIIQKIEAQFIRDLEGQDVTLTFEAAQSSGTTLAQGQVFIGAFTASDNGTVGAFAGPFNFPLSGGGATKQTIHIPAANMTNMRNGAALIIRAAFGASPVAGTYTFDYGNVQLERGTVASDFEFRPYQVELALSKRYYQTVPQWLMAGYNSTGSPIYMEMMLPVEMRTTPSVSYANTTYFNASTMALNAANPSHVRSQALIAATGMGYAIGDVNLSAELP